MGYSVVIVRSECIDVVSTGVPFGRVAAVGGDAERRRRRAADRAARLAQMLLPALRGPVHPSVGFCERCGAGAPPNMWYWPWRSDGS